MIISYQWLLEYLPKQLPVNELSEILTSIGLEVEAVQPVETVRGSLEGLVIGEVLTCIKHPNADKLSLTTVSIGGTEPLKIVCGAPNVSAGQKVIVAPAGTTIYPFNREPVLMKKTKIRGEESAGMICAEDEIGLSEDHAGIIILPDLVEPGTPARDYYRIPKADYAIHIGLTPNRSDANSHMGVARDVCAFLTHAEGKNYEIAEPLIDLTEASDNPVKVNVSIPNACPRYAGICIDNISVGASPDWLVQRLNAIEVRSINNIVDITNYVLHIYGQPLHAFDKDKIGGSTINVRNLPEGSKFTTLDGKERSLNGHEVMICDDSLPIAMGGVFGGLESGITDNTKNILIESAYFTPTNIFATSHHHGLRTDAALHFEKGVDINKIIPALKHAAKLILEVAGGKVSSKIIDVYPVSIPVKRVEVSYSYIKKLSGKQYREEQIKTILISLGFIIEEENALGLILVVPSNKPDVTLPADIVEEIVRVDGLNKIEIPEKLNISLIKSLPSDRAEHEKIAQMLCGMGLQEIVTNSIVNGKYYPDNTSLVKMINSLSSELDTMRPSMLESGLEVISYNCNRKNNNLCLFEFGNVYFTNNGKYQQETQLAIWITSNMQNAAGSWSGKSDIASIWQLKGIINNLISYSGIKNYKLEYTDHRVIWKLRNKEVLCSIVPVEENKLSEFGIKQGVFYGEIHWGNWLKTMKETSIRYNEVPKYPAVQRDLALVLDVDIPYRNIEEATEQLKLNSLVSFNLFDVFENEKLGAGKKSFAVNYTFQLPDQTLTDAEVEEMMKKLINEYKNKFNIQIRE